MKTSLEPRPSGCVFNCDLQLPHTIAAIFLAYIAYECQIACGPGSIRVLLNNPWWEMRLLRFLELSGVGRLVGDEDVEETRAARLDGWIAWEAEERVAR